MNNIDDALAYYVGRKKSELVELLETADLTVAELSAIKIILEALEDGGRAMQLLVERTGGKAVQRALSVTANASDGAAEKLAALLSTGRGNGSKKEITRK